jgi:hypothetical protein
VQVKRVLQRRLADIRALYESQCTHECPHVSATPLRQGNERLDTLDVARFELLEQGLILCQLAFGQGAALAFTAQLLVTSLCSGRQARIFPAPWRPAWCHGTRTRQPR